MSLIDQLNTWDNQLLLVVNGLAGNQITDGFMLAMSAKFIWIPLYALLLVLLWKRLGSQSLAYVLLGAFLTVVITDQGSVYFFKETFQRLRPCHNMDLIPHLDLLGRNCGGRFSFVSSHAANVFGVASFVFTLDRVASGYGAIFFWAFLVALSRVYLGVHYPSDVVVGAFYGSFVGFASGHLFSKTRSL